MLLILTMDVEGSYISKGNNLLKFLYNACDYTSKMLLILTMDAEGSFSIRLVYMFFQKKSISFTNKTKKTEAGT